MHAELEEWDDKPQPGWRWLFEVLGAEGQCSWSVVSGGSLGRDEANEQGLKPGKGI